MLIIDLFNVKAAKSKGFESYEQGKIPFVTNGIKNNGIVGYVEPKEKDKIFLKNALCVSAFCEVTVQKTPFLPRNLILKASTSSKDCASKASTSSTYL